MIKNYLTTALRFLLKNKTFSLINILGLAMGTLCCLYILAYVGEQYSYDKWEDHASDIYRITTDMKLSGVSHRMATTSPPIAVAMKRDLPEVQQTTRVFKATAFGIDQHLLKYKNKSFLEKDAIFVDSTFFDVFSYRFLRGDPAGALKDPFSVVLMKTTADKLFGAEDPVGKTIRINDKTGEGTLKVTGVLDDRIPERSHIQASVFITMNSGLIGNIIRKMNSWSGGNLLYSYVKLQPGTDHVALEKKLGILLNRYGAAQLKMVGMEKRLLLQPVATIHTTPDLEVELSRSVSPSFLAILSMIALLIQVIACINFMNLATARASKRAKEVGIRKVIGAGRRDLVRQFLGESLLLSFAGVLLALPLLYVLLPYLNEMTRADVSFSLFSDYRTWLAILGLVAITGLVSGSYPAFYLSAFQAIKVIKGDFINRVSAAALRRSLVVFQFSLSIILITGIVIIYSQLNYIKNKDLGFDKREKIILNIYTTKSDLGGLLGDLRLLPGVKAAAASNSQLGKPIIQDRIVYLGGGTQTKGMDVQDLVADQYFVRAAGIRLLAGHDFRESDSGKVIINEMLARALGLDPARAEGTILYSKWGENPEIRYEIAGVAKDFNFSSLHEAMSPFLLICNPKSPDLGTVTVSCNTGNYKQLLSKMGVIWHKYVPEAPFEYVFLDDEVQKLYETEITLAKIINLFTGIALLISCLGLFGLAAFSAEQRSKEIGVRKVLGASIAGVVRLLSLDFLRLVGIALVISIPVSWWAMHQWLQGFAYQVPIRWWMFALSGASALVIAFLTISLQTAKAASTNPVKTLRSE